MGGGGGKIRKDQNTIRAERTVANAYRDDVRDFKTNVMPLLNQLSGSLNDNSMITQAIQDNKQSAEMSAGEQARNAGRFGLGFASPSQKTAFTNKRKRDLAANMAGNENNSRIRQKDRNENVALGLTTLGNNYAQQGMDDMMNAIGIGSNRAQANAQSKAQARQANIGTAASLATMAIMAF